MKNYWPQGLNFQSYKKDSDSNPNINSIALLRKHLEALLDQPRGEFLKLHLDSKPWLESLELSQYFSDKSHFVHVGIGGSSLGPEMMIRALLPLSKSKNFTFINNIDPDYVFEQLEQLKQLGLEQCLFFIVSKSGHTAETLATLILITNILKSVNINEDQWKDYIVIASDKKENDLRSFADCYKLSQLNIPDMVGGRFSTLTPVGLFPCAWAGLSLHKIRGSCENFLKFSKESNGLYELALEIFDLYKTQDINQTVMMPYSSKMSAFTQWFVQLWAESLGKKHSLSGKVVHTGFTPIAAVGATDQHSQMQLFMEGPKDKYIVFIEIDNSQNSLNLRNNFSWNSFQKLSSYSMKELLHAELIGEMQALSANNRPWGLIKMTELNEESLTSLILLFESLTVLEGYLLSIDPFDQPGVELGKTLAFKSLAEQVHHKGTPLL